MKFVMNFIFEFLTYCLCMSFARFLSHAEMFFCVFFMRFYGRHIVNDSSSTPQNFFLFYAELRDRIYSKFAKISPFFDVVSVNCSDYEWILLLFVFPLLNMRDKI